MNATPNDPLDPLAWLARAESNLVRTRIGHGAPGVFLEDLLFDAQQAAEKAIKALLVARAAAFPRTHDLADLLDRLESAAVSVPPIVRSAVKLNPYAIRMRYPGGPSVTEADYEEAIQIADEVVAWARRELGA